MGLALRMAGRGAASSWSWWSSSPATCSSATATGSLRCAVSHRGPALGYVLYEDERPGEFDKETALRLGLERGPRVRPRPARRDDPRRDPGPGARPGPAGAQAGAVGRHPSVRVAAHRRPPRRRARPRGDVRRGGARARRRQRPLHRRSRRPRSPARPRSALLALNHVSTRHPLGQLRDEARAIFPNTVVPRDFDTIEIPFAERGEPSLLRWDERMAGRATRGAGMREAAPGARDPRDAADDRRAARARARGRAGRAHPGPARLPHAVAVGLPADPRRRARRAWWTSATTGSATASGCGCCATAATGEMVGRGGLQYTDAIGGFAVEAAWAIIAERLGTGPGHRAGPRVGVGGASTSLDVHELIAITLPDNHASRRVMEKAGFGYDRDDRARRPRPCALPPRPGLPRWGLTLGRRRRQRRLLSQSRGAGAAGSSTRCGAPALRCPADGRADAPGPLLRSAPTSRPPLNPVP